MIRTLLGLVAGMVLALVVIMSLEGVAYRLFPMPGFDEQQTLNVSAQPPAALAFVMAAWALGVALGAYVAVRLSRQRWTAWAIAGAIIAAVMIRFALLAHPVWVMAGGVLLPLLGAWLTLRLACPPNVAAD